MSVPKGWEIVECAYYHLEETQFSPQEVYKKLEGAYVAKAIPEVKVEYFDHKEGGMLSAKRTYLRLYGHGEHYDIGAMPYGKDFIISIRHCRTANTLPASTFTKRDIMYGFHSAVMRVFSKTIDDLTSGQGVMLRSAYE
jgi:hypothetical protein